jgi:hypothetical protein
LHAAQAALVLVPEEYWDAEDPAPEPPAPPVMISYMILRHMTIIL